MPVTTQITDQSLKQFSHELLALSHDLQSYWQGSTTMPTTRYTIESVTDRTTLMINLIHRLTEELQRLRELGIVSRHQSPDKHDFTT